MEEMRNERKNESWRGLLVFSMLAALVCRFAHTSIFLATGYLYAALPGIGLTVTQWGILLAGLMAAKKAGRLRLRGNKTGVFLLFLGIMQGACYGIFGDPAMRLLNLPVLAVLTVQSLLSVAGQAQKPVLSCAGLWEGFLWFWETLFRYFDVPFRNRKSQEERKSRRDVGIGLLLCVPFVFIVTVLLSSADSVFGNLFSRLFDRIRFFSATSVISFLWRAVTALLLGMMLFSFLYGLTQSPRDVPMPKDHPVRPAVFLLPLGCLAVLYALFAYIQVRYLFMGHEEAAMQGGYAAYARSGFFQLTAVSVLSLTLILPALTKCGKSRIVRIAAAAVLALVSVILFSAFFRMRLYILEYGLSLLRLLTLWAMLMILLALILGLVKCCCPDVRIFPILAASLLAGWVALNYLNVDAVIAQYNVRMYNMEEMAHLDTDYLIENLSPDVIPALKKIEGLSIEEQDALWNMARDVWTQNPPEAYNWSLSQLKTGLIP